MKKRKDINKNLLFNLKYVIKRNKILDILLEFLAINENIDVIKPEVCVNVESRKVLFDFTSYRRSILKKMEVENLINDRKYPGRASPIMVKINIFF